METITLKHPFEYEGKTIETVDFNGRLKTKDLLTCEAEMAARGIVSPGPATQTLYIISSATGLEPEALKEMDLSDYVALSEKVSAFL
jgi:hypothetical protein